MAFVTTLPRYTLVECMAAAPSTNAGSQGYVAEFDVFNALNGDVIVTKSMGPRAAAFAALTGGGVAATAIVTYQNSSGSVWRDNLGGNGASIRMRRSSRVWA
jgi:hypothetical protein